MAKNTRQWKNKPKNEQEIIAPPGLRFEEHKHYDFKIEASVLGCAYMFRDSMYKLRRFLLPEMFYYPLNQSIYRCIMQMYDKGIPIDMLTLINFIANDTEDQFLSQLKSNGNWAYKVSELSLWISSPVHVDYHAYLVREMFITRRLLILTTAGIGEVMAREKLLAVQKEVDNLMQFRVEEDEWLHISSVLVKLWQWMASIQDVNIIGVPSGFQNFDQITSGFVEGLYYLGARPSVGKTALALKMIVNQAQNDIPVGIISLEMPGIQLGARALSMVSNTPFWQIFRNKMSDEKRKELLSVYSSSLSQVPIYIADTSQVNMSDIKAKAMKLVTKHKCQILYLDYLQLVSPEEGAGTREQEVAKLSRGLKLLSMQLGIPIIALAQLSRESEKRQGAAKKPRLIDLRESGSIEQDADGVMLLHRDWKVGIKIDEDPDSPYVGMSTENMADLMIAKWRNGEIFDHKLMFRGEQMDFVEPEEVEKVQMHVAHITPNPNNNQFNGHMPTDRDEPPF